MLYRLTKQVRSFLFRKFRRIRAQRDDRLGDDQPIIENNHFKFKNLMVVQSSPVELRRLNKKSKWMFLSHGRLGRHPRKPLQKYILK